MKKKTFNTDNTPTGKTNKRKKHHCFLNLLSSLVISIVLVFGVVFGGIYFAYEKLARPITEMSLFEMLEVLKGTYIADESKIITNPYDPTIHTDEFFNGFSDSLLLKESITMDDLIDSMNSGTPLATANESTVEEDGTGNNMFDELLKESEFDFSDLKNYSGEDRAFKITDKMLASVTNETFYYASELVHLAGAEEALGLPLNEAIGIGQIIINSKPEAYENTTMSFTVRVNVKNIVNAVLNKNAMSDNTKNIVNMFTPEKIFFTGTITPLLNGTPALQINSIDEKLMNKTICAIDNIMAKTGTEMSFSSILNKTGETIYNVFNKIGEVAGANGIYFSSQDDVGNISIDTIQMMMSTMEVENVTSSDFLLMLQHLHSIDNSGMTEEDYLKTLTNLSRPEDYDISRDSLLATYGISNEDAQKYTPDNLLEQLPNISKDINLDNKINGEPLYTYTQNELVEKSIMSDKALAQIMNAQFNKQTEGSETNIDMTVWEFTLDGKEFNITAGIDIRSLVASKIVGNPMEKLILSIFPQQMYINITAPYEQSTGEGEISSKIIFNVIKGNDVKEASDDMINTLSALVKAIDPEINITKDELCKRLDTQLYDALKQLNNNDIGFHTEFKTGYAQMSTCYEVMAKQAQSEEKPTPENVQRMLYHLNTIDTNGITKDDYIAYDNLPKYSTEGDYIASRNTLTATYGITPETVADYDAKYSADNLIASLPDLAKDINLINGKFENTNVYNHNQAKLKANARLTDEAFAQIMNNELNNTTSENKVNVQLTILELDMDGTNFNITASIDPQEFIAGKIEENPLKNAILSMLPEQLYVKIIAPYTRNTTEGAISSNIIFNTYKGNDEVIADDSDNMLSTMFKFVPNNNKTKEELCKTLDDQLYAALDKMNNDSIGFKTTFENGYAQMSTCYEVIAAQNKNADVTLSPEEVHIALQDFYTTNNYIENGNPKDNLTGITLDEFITRELVGKLFFNQGVFKPDTLLADMKNLDGMLSPSNITTNINVDGIKNNSTPLDPQVNNIYITAQEIAVLLSSEISDQISSDLLAMYKDIKMTYSRVNEDNKLCMTLYGVLDENYTQEGLNLTLQNIAPHYMFVEAIITLRGTGVEPKIDMVINNATNSPIDQDTTHLENLMNIINLLSGKTSNINNVTSEVEKQLFGTKGVNNATEDGVFTSMEKNGLKFTANYQKGAYGQLDSTNIYDILNVKMQGEANVVAGEDELLRGIIYELNNTADFLSKTSNISTTAPANGITVAPTNPDELPVPTQFDITIKDTYMGYVVNNKIKELGAKPYTVKRVNLLNAVMIPEYFNYKHAGISSLNEDVLATVFEIRTAEVLADSGSIANKFMPTNLYTSILIERDGGGEHYTFSNMNEAEISYLNKIIVIKEGGQTLDQIIHDAVQNAIYSTVIPVNVSGKNVDIPLNELMGASAKYNASVQDARLPEDTTGNYGNLFFQVSLADIQA